MGKKSSKKTYNQSKINADVKNMIHNLSDSGTVYPIENNASRIVDNVNQIDTKQIVQLHNLLLEQFFIKKQYNFILDVNKNSINLSDIYSQILQQDLPTLRELMQYKGIIKLLYFLKLQFQIHELDVIQNVKYSYIKFRSKSLRSLIPAVEQIQKTLVIYNQNISNLTDDVINNCISKRTLIAQHLYLEKSNFLTLEQFKSQYQKIRQYWYYVNINPGFDPIRLIIFSKFQQYFEATLNLPMENNFYQLVTYIQSGAKSLGKQYENSIILDDDTEMVYAMTMFKPVAICYLLSKQNYIQQYELSLCRQIFLNNTNTTKELDKIMLHIKCETLEIFDDTIIKFIKNCNLYESIVILNYMVSQDLVDTISNSIFKVLSSQLDKMIMLQITNKRIQTIKSFDSPLERIQEVVYGLRKIQIKIQQLQNCSKQESVTKILCLEQKAQTIIQFVERVLISQNSNVEVKEQPTTRGSIFLSKNGSPEQPEQQQARPMSQLTNDNPMRISDLSNLSQVFANLKNDNRQVNVYLDEKLLKVCSIDVSDGVVNIHTKVGAE